jgi:hypothetical protein
LESRMTLKGSRPVRRKEIGDVLLCGNAPISYPTKGKVAKEHLQS